MIVASILNTKGSRVYSIGAGTPVRDAARYLAEHRIGAAMVLDDAGAPAGVFSERDLLLAVAERGGPALGCTVGEFMARDIAVCTPTDQISSVMATMTDRRCRHLPVVDQDRVVGVISIGDVVKSRISEAETEAAALKAYIATG